MGLAIDVLSTEYGSLDDGFAKTKAYNWLVENMGAYGFILRYPLDEVSLTGYGFEPWHLRYVGVDVAEAIRLSGVTLEEYIDAKEQGYLKKRG